jgi:hypothetical protein
MKYAPPGHTDSIVTVAPRSESLNGGKRLASPRGTYRAALRPSSSTSRQARPRAFLCRQATTCISSSLSPVCETPHRVDHELRRLT